MKIPIDRMLEAVAVLEKVPKVNALPSSHLVQLIARTSISRLYLRAASTLQAAAWVDGEVDEPIQASVDRALFLQWIKGLKKIKGAMSISQVDDTLIVKAGRRSGKFPLQEPVEGFEPWPKTTRATKLDLEGFDLDFIRLALNYAGGEGIDPALDCIWFTGDSLLASNQLSMLKASVSANWRGPVPLDLIKTVTPDSTFWRNTEAARVSFDGGSLYRTYDRDTLKKFPEKHFEKLFTLASKFTQGITLYPIGSVLSLLREMSQLANKAEAEDITVEIDTETKSGKALFKVATPSGMFREALDVTSPGDRLTILIPPLMPFLSLCPSDAAVEILYGDKTSPFLVKCENLDAQLLISRKVI
jgi:hypothetical protein